MSNALLEQSEPLTVQKVTIKNSQNIFLGNTFNHNYEVIYYIFT